MFEKNNNKVESDTEPVKTVDNLKNTIGIKKRGRESNADKEAKAQKAKAAKQVDDLFNSEVCGDLASIPFELAVIGTGSEIFKLSDKEKKSLGVPFEITLKAFELTKDPKYFALGILLVNYGKLFATKGLAWKLEQDKNKEQSKKKNDKESLS